MTTMRDCPTGCARKVRAGHLLCTACWRRVPRDLQAEVHRTWKAWLQGNPDANLMRAYRHAADSAIRAASPSLTRGTS